MPAKSKAQRKMIFARRSKYKTKEKTPDKWKWIWDKGYENKGELPEKVEENTMNLFDKYLAEAQMLPELTRSGRGLRRVDDNLTIPQYSAEKMEEIIKEKKAEGLLPKTILDSLWQHGFPYLSKEDQNRLRSMME